MTNDEKQSLMEIQGTPGFRVLEYIIKVKLADLKDVTNIKAGSPSDIAIETLAAQRSATFLQEFLYDLGFSQTIKKDNTYE